MGKGDKKSKKGKRFSHSYGKTRPRKKKRIYVTKKKTEEKPKPVEQQKLPKQETEIIKTVVVEPKVEEITITKPQITEIKEEVSLPEIKEEPVANIPEVYEEVVAESPVVETEPIDEKPTVEEPSAELQKSEPLIEDKPAEAAPKKRGRPKKKKE